MGHSQSASDNDLRTTHNTQTNVGGGDGGGGDDGDETAEHHSLLRTCGLDIVTPGGECLARAVDLHVTPSRRLLVTGPNASGKTALFRVLGVLWPARSAGATTATADHPASLALTAGGVFLVPQRVYSVM